MIAATTNVCGGPRLRGGTLARDATDRAARPDARRTPRWAFEAAYDDAEGGDWYMHENNGTAPLAWGEGYVLQSLAVMARATGHPIYFDRLARVSGAAAGWRRSR